MNVFEKGNILAKIMILGQSPGLDEDKSGVPFVGPAGQLVDEILLGDIGLTYEDMFFTNVVTFFPFVINYNKRKVNRDLTAQEVKDGIPRLKSVLYMTKPKLIIALGQIASSAMRRVIGMTPINMQDAVGSKEQIRNKKGEVVCHVIYTYHPSSALRQKTKEDTDERTKQIVDSIMNSADLIEEITGRAILRSM